MRDPLKRSLARFKNETKRLRIICGVIALDRDYWQKRAIDAEAGLKLMLAVMGENDELRG